MKYIFDFDDTLFHTTKSLKERIYDIYIKKGISRDQILEYVKRERKNGFSLKRLLKHFSLEDELYEDIMSNSESFVNQEVLKLVKSLGKENCFIITAGDEEFQRDKIIRARLEEYFTEIIVVLGSKKAAVEEICKKFQAQEVVFIDDKKHFFEDLDFKKCSNLKTILYVGQTAEALREEISQFNK